MIFTGYYQSPVWASRISVAYHCSVWASRISVAYQRRVSASPISVAYQRRVSALRISVSYQPRVLASRISVAYQAQWPHWQCLVSNLFFYRHKLNSKAMLSQTTFKKPPNFLSVAISFSHQMKGYCLKCVIVWTMLCIWNRNVVVSKFNKSRLYHFMWGSAWYNGRMFGFHIKCLRINFHFTQIFLWERFFLLENCVNQKHLRSRAIMRLPLWVKFRNVLTNVLGFYAKESKKWSCFSIRFEVRFILENRTGSNSQKRSLVSWAFWSQSRFDLFCYSTGSVLSKWIWNASPTF